MIISASQVVLHEAGTCDGLQLPFPLVPELVRRSVMDEYGPTKRLRQLHLGQHSRSKGHARLDAEIDFVHGSGHRLAIAAPTASSDREGFSATWYPGPNRSVA